MCQIIDFYQYKYSRCNYYINIFISKESAKGLESLIDEKLKNKKVSREYRCAYKMLRKKLNNRCEDMDLIKIRLNKCYLQYLKDLYYDFYGREEDIYVKEVIQHLQFFIEEDSEDINRFYDLKESIRINILSMI